MKHSYHHDSFVRYLKIRHLSLVSRHSWLFFFFLSFPLLFINCSSFYKLARTWLDIGNFIDQSGATLHFNFFKFVRR